KLMRDAGFDATCIWWEDTDESRKRLRDRVPEMVRADGLSLDNIHVPYDWTPGLWSVDRAARTAAVAKHVSWVEDCGRHGIPRMVMHLVLGAKDPWRIEDGLDSVLRIVEAAEERGVTVAIENTRCVERIDAILDLIPSPHLGLCFDSAHDLLYSPAPLELLSTWGHRLAATHFSDTDGRRDYHWSPGEGRVDFEAIAQSMASHGYEGSLVIESVSRGGEGDAKAYLESARERLVAIREAMAARFTLDLGAA
ncbi:MAG: sugar phosphate isomerase/epimerase family protein, partial [Candidatus Hydrogenedentes bacterium]|nr:sugar phosphate isomerase/epimerase family protein [Candidatus Hydrogenedentota bacterium]